jgi:hypothetical protein
MKIADRHFPFPVLTYFDDNVNSLFYVSRLNAVLDADKENYSLTGEFITDNTDLIAFVKNKTAAFVLHFECPKTRFRKPFHFFSNEFQVKIPTRDIDGKVELQPAIILKEKVSNFLISNAHQDYMDMKFHLNTGDVIAVAEPLEFVASKSLDSLKNFPSIFSISKNVQYPEKTMDINFNNNKIQILLSEENYKNYRISSNDSSKEAILAAMLLFPAIHTLFRDFSENTSEYEDYLWFPTVKRRVEECGYKFDDISWEDEALEVAHSVIGDPLKKGLLLLASDGDDK